jgi:hypothetical protein
MKNFEKNPGLVALYRNVHQIAIISQEKSFTSVKDFVINPILAVSRSEFKIDPQFPQYKPT